jgi:parvulin-like peptidyl-prolyl isomerase
MRRILLLAAAFLLTSAQAPAPDAVVAEAGDAKVTVADVKNLLAAAGPDVRTQLASDPSSLDRLARSQVVQILLLQEAHAHQWDAKPDVAFRAQQAHDAAIAGSYLASLAAPPADYPSDAEVDAAYEAQKSRLMLPRQYHLAQIFVALPENAPAAAEADAKKRLASIHQLLARPHADFAAIAQHESDDKTSAAAGGDLGWLPEDRLRSPLREAVAGMQEDAVSEPLRTADGWHLIRLLGTKPAAPAPLADVRAQLVQALRQQRIAATEQKLIDDMLRRQPIRLDEIGLQHAVNP